MINVHQTGCQKTPASSLLSLLLVVNIWSISSESCLLEFQHDLPASKTDVSVQNIIMKDYFQLSHCTVVWLDWRNQKSSNLWTLWPGAGCYQWFDLGKDHRSVHPRLTGLADALLRLCLQFSTSVLMLMMIFQRQREREKANFTPICQNWSVNFPQNFGRKK